MNWLYLVVRVLTTLLFLYLALGVWCFMSPLSARAFERSAGENFRMVPMREKKALFAKLVVFMLPVCVLLMPLHLLRRWKEVWRFYILHETEGVNEYVDKDWAEHKRKEKK